MEIDVKIILSAMMFLIAVISYIAGTDNGKRKERKHGMKAYIATIRTLEEAQKEAGVSKEQVKKINKYLAKEIMTYGA